MKRRYILVMFLFLASLYVGCKKESVGPPPIVDGLIAYSGKYRAMVEFNAPVGATSGKVFFGNGKFKEFQITTEGKQSVDVSDLPEGEQTLRVVTYNLQQAVSDPKAVNVRVYGLGYESSLKARKWKDQITNSVNSIQIVFDTAAQNETGVRLVYTNTSGQKDSVLIKNSQNSVTLNSINTNEPYYYYSIYKPNPSAIDEFWSLHVDAKNAVMLDFRKANWKIAGVSNQATDRNANLLIDNDINTSWQSGGISQPGSFQWISVDMGSDKFINGFYYVNAQTNEKSPQSISIEISSDNVNWSKVVEADIRKTFLRQRFQLNKTVTARYFKMTVRGSEDPNANTTQFAEIDAFNDINVSAQNGKDQWTTIVPIALKNAKNPFSGDGSNPFPPLGDFRLQRVKDWAHNAAAVVSYDNNGNGFSLFSIPVWGLGEVSNGKISQSVNLQPGKYRLQIDVGGKSGPTDVFGLVTSTATFPDYNGVSASSDVLNYSDLAANPNTKMNLEFIVPTAMPVTLGIVYNLRDQFSINGTPWTNFSINEFALSRVE